MSKKTLVTTLIIQSFCWFSVIWFLSGNNTVEARYLLQVATPQPFVGSIYYGQKSVWQVFDHNFPNDGQENNYVVHYDGTQHNPATNTPAAPGATPVPGEWIRDGYGYDDHVGIDYGLIYQPVLAAASGIVETAGWSSASARSSAPVKTRLAAARRPAAPPAFALAQSSVNTKPPFVCHTVGL